MYLTSSSCQAPRELLKLEVCFGIGVRIMKNFQSVKETIKKHESELKRKYRLKRLGLFGSFVRGEQKKGSDIDILVEFEKPISLFEFIGLEEDLETALGSKVDLVSKKALKFHLGKYILEEVQYV